MVLTICENPNISEMKLDLSYTESLARAHGGLSLAKVCGKDRSQS